MVRRKFPSSRDLAVTIVAAAVVALSTIPVLAQPAASSAPASPRSGAAACRASDLRISAPATIPGDPADGMGKQVWNLVFRNIGGASCSLRGWPQVVVRTTAGKSVATKIGDVTFGNLAVVPDAPVVLRPGQSAVVTAMSRPERSGCASNWMLGLTLPGADRPVTVRGPASALTACLGGQLWLSPLYAEQTLLSQIKGLKVSAAPPPFSATAAVEPPACQAAALRVRVTSAVSGHAGSVVLLQLSNVGGTCVLPGSWPTVRVGEAGDAAQAAKLLSDAAALQAETSSLTSYQRGTAQGTALAVRHGGSVSIALLGAGACRRLTSVTVFASAAAGHSVHVAASGSMCGSPRVLSYLPSRPGVAMTIARKALGALQADPPTTAHAVKSAVFYYGTDSSAPVACGRGPYTEPNGDCANGTHGIYGEYIGELGSWLNWRGCTDSGLNWVQANYNMATDNLVRYHRGLGAAAYWFAAGPGRDPHYNGTTTEAMIWGRRQAVRFVADSAGVFLNFRYVFMDIENNGFAPDGNGWNTVWNSPCGNKIEAEFIAPQVDLATVKGFASYINAHSPYRAAVYSAGGPGYGSWTGIFAPELLAHTAEWTFTNEQTQLTFPSGFSNSGSSAEWFGGEPAACQLLWQWSGGNGDLNGFGDFDQAEAANVANSRC
jgi:hypothetical protein